MYKEIEKLRKDKAKAESEGQWKDVAAICNCIGQAYCKIGQYEEALAYHREELELCTMHSDQLGIAVANRRIGECYCVLNNFKKAIHHQKIFLDLAIKQGSTVEEQRAWATLGRTYYFLYESDTTAEREIKQKVLNKAEQSFKKALDLADNLKTVVSSKDYAEMRARALLNLGLVYESRGRLEECANSIRHAIFLAKKYNLYEDLHRCQVSLAAVYQSCEKYNYALRLLDDAIASAKILHDKSFICEAMSSKASILIHLKDFEGARTYLKKAYKLHSPIESDHDRSEKKLKIVIGLCKCEQRLLKTNNITTRKTLLEEMADRLSVLENFKLAVEYYLLTLECLNSMQVPDVDKAPIYFSLAQTYADDHNYNKALEYFKKEFDCNQLKPVEQIKTLCKIANIYEEMGNFEEIRKSCNDALLLVESLSNSKLKFKGVKLLLNYYSEISKSMTLKEVGERLHSYESELKNTSDTDSSEEEDDGENNFYDVPLSELSDCTDSDIEKEMSDGPLTKRRARQPNTKRNELGETPLHRACITNNFQMVKRLVESGHPVNARDNCGWLPLHEACNYGFYEIVEYLLTKGALINDRGGTLCEGTTPLHDTASCGHLDVMELLISRGASVIALNNSGESPLDVLNKWRAQNEKDLGEDVVEQCKNIETKLRNMMKQVGHVSATKSSNMSAGDVENDVKMSISASKSLEKRARSSSDSSSNDEELEINCTDNAWKTDNDVLDHKYAEAEYQAVMSSLRRSGKSLPPVSHKAEKSILVSALIDENKMTNDWLIHDVKERTKTAKKKRKKNSQTNIRKTNHSMNSFVTFSKESKKNPLQTDNVDSENSNCAVDSDSSNSAVLDLHQKAELQEQIQNNVSKNSEINRNKSCSFYLRVNITDKIVLVPVINDLCTVEWLAEEASKRFHSIVGNKPNLIVMKKDGALLSPSDLIKVIFQNNEEVATTVNSWYEPSIEEHYEQACIKSNVKSTKTIKELLNLSSTTFVLNFSDIVLPLAHLKTVFCSLKYCQTLRYLNLSNTEIVDDALQSFISCFSCFQNLASLILSCCGLTSNSVYQIAEFLNNDHSFQKLPKLKMLDLSYNCFSDECSKAFCSILKLPSLVILNLEECNLSQNFFLEKIFCDTLRNREGLQELNVSGNILEALSIAEMLSCLPYKDLIKLNLSHTVQSRISLGNHLAKFISQHLSSLLELHLEDCKLTDKDLQCITKCISFCPQLNTCNISSNPLLTTDSIIQLIRAAFNNNIPLHTFYMTGFYNWQRESVFCLASIFNLKLLRKIMLDNISDTYEDILFDAWTEHFGEASYCANGIVCELNVK